MTDQAPKLVPAGRARSEVSVAGPSSSFAMRAKPIPFGKYYLLDRVNTGGMAEVFRAKAIGVEGFERVVAVKRILPNIAADVDFIGMFIDEAKLAVQLNHANIAQIFDLGKVDDSYFIALEYVHGKDLRAVFEHVRTHGQTVPIELACYVMMKICEGLDYAHGKRDAGGHELQLVHRDVSPQNMLISFDGDVKLIDFGIAKAIGKASRTRTGVLKGKFGYLSPEQVRGEAVDQRSDIFGVGIVLYELLTGERLFSADNDFSAIEKVRSVEIASPCERNPAIPQKLDYIVMTTLSRDPDTRYQSALELHDELQGFLHARGALFGRKELSAWMLSQFPEDAARDPEAVGDLTGADPLAYSPIDRTPIVAPTESIAVFKETRDGPAKGKAKQPSTILGMPAVLPPADLAVPRPTRSSMPPPPPPSGGLSGTRPPAPPGGRVGTVPPRARTEPPAPPGFLPDDPSGVALPAPIGRSTLPSGRGTPPGGRSLPPPPPRTAPPPPPLSATLMGTGAPQNGAVLDLDWDDEEELSTQIYDRPSEGGEYEYEAAGDEQAGPFAASGSAPQQVAYTGTSGLPDYAQPGAGHVPPPPGALGSYNQVSPPGQYGAFGSVGTAPPGVQVAPHAYGYTEPPPPPPESVPMHVGAPMVSPQTLTMTTERPLDRGRNPVYAALAVAAVGLLCFVGYVFLAQTEPGVVTLTTHPADAVLLFDGKQVGTGSPFVITGVSPSDKHKLEVQKPGYRTWSQEVQVHAGQTLQFPVTLQPADGTAPAPVAAAGQPSTGGFSIETTPPGATVFLDGQQLGGVTPLRVGNLLARSYQIRVKLDGFREQEQKVEVQPAVDQSLPRIALEADRVRVRIASEPAGAEAVLVHKSERRVLGRTPVDVTLDNDGSRWSLEVSKSGYQTYTQPLALSGGAELSVRAVLAGEGEEPQAVAVAEEPAAHHHHGSGRGESAGSEEPRPSEPRASASEPRASAVEPRASASEPRASEPASERSERAERARPEPAASSEGGPGTLRINTRPWSQVSIDGRAIGNTPQMNIPLPAGNHRVQLVNPEFNLRKTLTINIKPGQVETQIIALQ